MSNWDPAMGGTPPPSGPPSGPPPGPPTGPSGPPPGSPGGGYGGPPPGYGGAPPGYGAPPPGYGGPPPGYPPPKKSNAALWVILGIGVSLVLLIIIGSVVVFVIAADDASADEVFLETATAPGPAPFTDSVAKNVVNTGTTSTSAASPPTTSAGASTGGVASTSGGEPGLYGGTKDIASCDAEKLIVFLETNPDKGRAWAGVLGIPYSDIRSYVKKLTSVVLRNDVRVTNHGWEYGRATTFQAVLQAGTAVLVDSYGRPVVKCYCGNPLTSPTPVKQVRYTGTKWVGFSPATIIVIQPTTVIIDTFTLTDPYGERFRRPAGTDGGDDGSGGPASTTTSTPPTTDSPTTTESPTTIERPTTTEPPVITAPPGNPAQGAWQLEGYYEISGQGVTGKSSWFAAIEVAPDGSISGSGSGQATGTGGCFNLDSGAQVSTYNASISFTVTVSGRMSGSTMQLTVSAGAINLDSLVYSPEVSENSGCRRDAQNGYRQYVTDQMSAFNIAAQNGAAAPVGSATKGTVTLGRH